MRRLWLLLLLAGCSKGPQADLQYVSEARSAAAEWAMVNEQANRGKLTATYVDSVRQSLREQVEAARSSLTQPDSDYSREISSLAGEADNAAPEALRAHAEKLKTIEDSLESA
jgi:hypothetical protein